MFDNFVSSTAFGKPQANPKQALLAIWQGLGKPKQTLWACQRLAKGLRRRWQGRMRIGYLKKRNKSIKQT